MPVFDNPRQVIVTPRGGPDALMLIAAAVVLAVAAAVAWFLITFAVVLAIGTGVIAVVLVTGMVLVRRYLTVVAWDEQAAQRVRRVQSARVLGVVIHRHVVVHQHVTAPAAPALENRHVIPGSVIPAARERAR